MCLHCVFLIIVGGIYGLINIFNHFCHVETFRHAREGYTPYDFSKDLKTQSGKGAVPNAFVCRHQRHKK